MKNLIYNKIHRLFTYSFGCLVLLACDDSIQLPDRGYTLVWSDEFEGTTGDPLNPDNWDFDIGTGVNGWGNNELQFYTDRPENVTIDGKGNMAITAINEPFQGRAYTSARVKTQRLQEFQYGRVEARIKTPFGQGIWPAFWMLGADFDEVGWPECGEIDIMEKRGQQPSIAIGSIHGPGYSGGDAISNTFQLINARFDTDYHIFAIDWGPDFIEFFVDKNLYQRLTPESLPAGAEWVFNKPFFIILNVAVGGDFLGSPTGNTRFPQTMLIDYVRVYQ